MNETDLTAQGTGISELSEEELSAVSGGAGSPHMDKYIWKEGDTLEDVSKACHTTVKMLCRMNGVTETDKIEAGRELLVLVMY